MNSFVVDRGRCRKDGICAEVCPVRIIRCSPGEYPVMIAGGEGRCIGCGQCMAFCPTKVCSAPGLSIDECGFLRRDLFPSPDQMEELVFARRSIRNYRDEAVPRETLARLLDAARYAPTAQNRQELRWIVLESRGQTVRLVHLALEWMRALPRTDPALAQAMRAEGLVKAWDNGVDLITRGAPQLAVAVAPDGHWGPVDSAIALTYLELLAQAHKIGCCWGGYLCLAFQHQAGGEIRDFLGIAADEKAYGAQMMGYPRFMPFSRPPRKALRVTWK